MGKSWFSIIKKAFVPEVKEDKDHKSQKHKKRWFGKQKSQDSIAYTEDDAAASSTAAASSQLLPPSPPPPPAQVAAPRPPLLPPSMPPLPLFPLPSTSTQPTSSEKVRVDESREEHTRKALVLATAVAAEAAVVAANAAADVVRLTTVARQTGKSEEEIAAIKIQTAYRGYMARRALRALRGMARLKTLVQGHHGKKQATAMLRSMQTLSRLQTQMQERRARITEENKARHKLLQQKYQQREQNNKTKTSNEEDFDVSTKSKEQIEARLHYRKEAAVRRERALAYAYSHQRTWRNSTKLPHQVLMDPNHPHWGWSWLERWMATRPWETQTKITVDENDEQAFVVGRDSNKSSIKQKTGTKPKTRKAVSQGAIQLPASAENNDSKSVKLEENTRRHSIAIGTTPLFKEDDESVSSSSTRRSSLGQKVVGKSRVSVSKASNSYLGSEKKKDGEAEQKPARFVKRRVLTSDSQKVTRRLSDSGRDMGGRSGGNRATTVRADG